MQSRIVFIAVSYEKNISYFCAGKLYKISTGVELIPHLKSHQSLSDVAKCL